MPDPFPPEATQAQATIREEWHVESVGGGITGPRAEVDAWLAAWRDEYGDRYPITLRRRFVSETEWEPVDA